MPHANKAETLLGPPEQNPLGSQSCTLADYEFSRRSLLFGLIDSRRGEPNNLFIIMTK